MTVATIELKKELFNSPVETTKDKVITFRVEESLYKLLEDLSQELETENVSQTVRKILRFYLLNAVYEEEWTRLHSQDFDKFLNQVEQAGEVVELENYRKLLSELSGYVELMRAIIDRINVSSEFFDNSLNKLEEITEKLEEVDIIWERGIQKGKKKME